MNELGLFLKESRLKNQFSQKNVQNLCGITDSRLSKYERGEQLPGPPELSKLAELYGIDLIDLYIKAGYLSKRDLDAYQFCFKDAELLTSEEQDAVQTLVNLFTKERTVADR